MSVMAFEPCLESYRVLEAEKPGNVTTVCAALSGAPGVVDLDEAEASISTGQLVNGQVADGHPEWGRVTGSRSVVAITLDSVVGQEGRLPEVVKVDTEGHEVKVLMGAKHTIALGYTAWFIEVHNRRQGTQMRQMFTRARYHHERIEHDYLVGKPQAADHYYMVVRPRSV
jgi:FkbM family methyltransferase